MRNVVVVVFLGGMVTGCATGRIADLRDCGHLSVGVGRGLDVSAKVGCVVHPSLGIASRTQRFGLENRVRYGTWEEEQIVWPVELPMQALARACSGSGTPLASYEHIRRPEMVSDPRVETSWLPLLKPGYTHPDARSFHELTDLEVGVTLAFVSIKVELVPQAHSSDRRE